MTKLSQVCTACTASSRGWGPYLEASIDRARVETRPAFVAHGAKTTKIGTTHGRHTERNSFPLNKPACGHVLWEIPVADTPLSSRLQGPDY